jgi:hypothetical protein
MSGAGGIGVEFKEVARLAAEHAADRLKCREADGACLAGLEDRQIGERDIDPLGELVRVIRRS